MHSRRTVELHDCPKCYVNKCAGQQCKDCHIKMKAQQSAARDTQLHLCPTCSANMCTGKQCQSCHLTRGASQPRNSEPLHLCPKCSVNMCAGQQCGSCHVAMKAEKEAQLHLCPTCSANTCTGKQCRSCHLKRVTEKQAEDTRRREANALHAAVLSWTAADLKKVERCDRIPNEFESFSVYYDVFCPLLLEETRANLLQGLESTSPTAAFSIRVQDVRRAKDPQDPCIVTCDVISNEVLTGNVFVVESGPGFPRSGGKRSRCIR